MISIDFLLLYGFYINTLISFFMIISGYVSYTGTVHLQHISDGKRRFNQSYNFYEENKRKRLWNTLFWNSLIFQEICIRDAEQCVELLVHTEEI